MPMIVDDRMETQPDSLVLSKFVRFVQGRLLLPGGEWEPVVERVLRDAGFRPLRVERKDCFGDYVDQDLSPTGERFLRNPTSKINAPQKSDHGETRATDWLNVVWFKVQSTPEGQAVDCLKQLIDESRPLTPIVMTRFKERLIEYPSDTVERHTRDTDDLGTCIGVHETCKGWMDRKHISPEYDAIVCRDCGLRIEIPNTIATYGDLRKYLDQKLASAPTP
jgi:hypothetical protein